MMNPQVVAAIADAGYRKTEKLLKSINTALPRYSIE